MLFQLKGAGVELIVFALLGDEVIVGASLNYSALLKNHDDIAVLYGGKAMCDNEYRSAVHKPIHSLLNYRLGSGIDRRGGFIEYHNGRVGYCCSCDREQLTLTLR